MPENVRTTYDKLLTRFYTNQLIAQRTQYQPVAQSGTITRLLFKELLYVPPTIATPQKRLKKLAPPLHNAIVLLGRYPPHHTIHGHVGVGAI